MEFGWERLASFGEELRGLKMGYGPNRERSRPSN